jgi:hypothetical protein
MAPRADGRPLIRLRCSRCWWFNFDHLIFRYRRAAMGLKSAEDTKEQRSGITRQSIGPLIWRCSPSSPQKASLHRQNHSYRGCPAGSYTSSAGIHVHRKLYHARFIGWFQLFKITLTGFCSHHALADYGPRKMTRQSLTSHSSAFDLRS